MFNLYMETRIEDRLYPHKTLKPALGLKINVTKSDSYQHPVILRIHCSLFKMLVYDGSVPASQVVGGVSKLLMILNHTLIRWSYYAIIQVFIKLFSRRFLNALLTNTPGAGFTELIRLYGSTINHMQWINARRHDLFIV